jgi:hypothetical protein
MLTKGSIAMAGELKNQEYLFTLLTALVKKNGGEIRISEKDLCTVTKQDLVTLLWDNTKNEVVLQTVGTTAGVTTNPPKGYYEN